MPKQQKMKNVSAGLRVWKSLVRCISIAKGAPARLDCKSSLTWSIAQTNIVSVSWYYGTYTEPHHGTYQRRCLSGFMWTNSSMWIHSQCFLETPSRDALIKLSSNSSLTCDPSARTQESHQQRSRTPWIEITVRCTSQIPCCAIWPNLPLPRHLRTHESGMDFSYRRVCDYPGCETNVRSLPSYKLHQIKVRGIHLISWSYFWSARLG